MQTDWDCSSEKVLKVKLLTSDLLSQFNCIILDLWAQRSHDENHWHFVLPKGQSPDFDIKLVIVYAQSLRVNDLHGAHMDSFALNSNFLLIWDQFCRKLRFDPHSYNANYQLVVTIINKCTLLQCQWDLCVVVWLYWCGSSGCSGFLPQHKDVQVMQIGNSKNSHRCEWECDRLSLCQPSDGLVTCPTCALPLATLTGSSGRREWMDGWTDGFSVCHRCISADCNSTGRRIKNYIHWPEGR